MFYDTLILGCCVAGGAVAWFATDEAEYIARARVYHIRLLYSTLAFPWLLLKLPLAYTLVLHLKPTGYNESGEVVRLCNAKERRAARDRRLAAAGGAGGAGGCCRCCCWGAVVRPATPSTRRGGGSTSRESVVPPSGAVAMQSDL